MAVVGANSFAQLYSCIAGRIKCCEGATATEEVLLGCDPTVLLGCGNLIMICILPGMDSRFHGNDGWVRE